MCEEGDPSAPKPFLPLIHPFAFSEVLPMLCPQIQSSGLPGPCSYSTFSECAGGEQAGPSALQPSPPQRHPALPAPQCSGGPHGPTVSDPQPAGELSKGRLPPALSIRSVTATKHFLPPDLGTEQGVRMGDCPAAHS